MKLTILDTTLRDGDQSAGFAFSVKEKVKIARALALARVDVIEAGFPLASALDWTACQAVTDALQDDPVRIALMCRCLPDEMAKTANLLPRNKGILHVSLPVSALHIRTKLNSSEAQLIARAVDAISMAVQLAPCVECGAEDATRADVRFLTEYCDAVTSAGARIVNIADTLGQASTQHIVSLVDTLMRRVPAFAAREAILSIHCHNDLGLAVANTLAAIQAGCLQIETSVGGLGERAGNAALEEVVANLCAHPGSYAVETKLRVEKIPALVRTVYEAAGVAPAPGKPCAGYNIQAHASGIHQHGLEQAEDTYRVKAVTDVPQRVVLSRHSGRSGIRLAAQYCGVMRLQERDIEQLLADVKENPVRSVGLTEFLQIMEKHKLLPPSFHTLFCTSMTHRYENTRYRVLAHLSSGISLIGEGPDMHDAILAALSTFSGLALSCPVLEGSQNGNTHRLYAEIQLPTRLRVPVERCGQHPDLLFMQICLDAYNLWKIRQIQEKT